jgi:hypothetical protein
MFPTRLFFTAGLGLLLWEVDLAAQTNGILREVYGNIAGNAVTDLTSAPSFPASPTAEAVESAFEAPSNFADNYGQRMRALLLPPATGSYVFWIASDDNSVLYLSTDEDPGHKRPIATVSSWTSSREWTKEAGQQSASITLTNGFRYYVEALQKEGGGGDNLAVRWRLPGGTIEEPIPGNRMVPYGLGPPVIASQPANTTVVEGGTALFTVRLARTLGAAYQWQRNGADLPSGTNATLTMAPAALADSGSLFNCRVTNPYGSTNSATVRLTVTADVTRPTISSVGGLGDPQILTVIFSEPVEASSATLPANYAMNHGVAVLSATFGADPRTIILTTSPMAMRTAYTLTINNVRDRAAAPNPILPDSQASFTLDSLPLDISFLRPPPEKVGPSTRHGPVTLSEIMYHPTNRADGLHLEFVELYNSNPYFEDISGFRLTGAIDFTFPTNTLLAALSYLVVAPSPADIRAVYGITNVTGGFTNRLSNGSDTLRLRNRQGAVLVEVDYSGDPPWPAAADGAGHSLVLAQPSLGFGDPAAWAPSDVVGGSPGRAEPSSANPYRTVLINEILAHTDPPDLDFIELFNYSTQAVDLSGCVLTDDPATNRFVLPIGTAIPAQGFLCFNQLQLGFALNAAGETIYFKNQPATRVLDSLRYGAQENGVSLGRFPDGATGFYRLDAKTPGANNARVRPADVVINEVMYDPVTEDNDDEYVELYNPGDSPVDLGKWRLEEAVEYTIPPETILPPGSYLVLARNAGRLLTNYPGLTGANTLGDFSGSLGNGGERIVLSKPDDILSTNGLGQVVTNHIHIAVDEVSYGVGGRWGTWAHGGGSSLELIDPHSDRRLAPNWADSDETHKSGWVTIEQTGVLDNGNGAADSLQIITLGAGEYLVDVVEVIPLGGANLIANPGFDSGLDGWVPQGNHEDSSLETGEGYNGSQCLHVRATAHGDTGANRIRTTLTAPLNAGQTATIRARVRWLCGCPEILFRLKGNWLEATGQLLTARNFGTPGAPNTRARPNVGPAITDIRHSPVLPANQAVTVVARVSDPDGLASLVLKYRLDPSTNLNLVSMVNNGAGLFSATIPSQAAGTLAAFHVQATDHFTPAATTLFPNDAPTRECLVRWGDPVQGGGFGTYRLWVTQATFDRWCQREKLSNKPLDGTFVYGTQRVIYNMGSQYAGSPWHAPGYDTPTGNVCDYVLNFPEDDRLLGETDISLQWPGNGGGDSSYQREQTAYWIADQLGLPACYRRHVNLFINGVRRAAMFEDVQQPNGDMTDEFYPDGQNGDLHKVQIWFEMDDAASTFTGVGASLDNVTTSGGAKKLARYRWTWAKRAIRGSANNYTNLFKLVDTVNTSATGDTYTRQLEPVLDVDNWLRTYAVEHIVGNNDSYAYGGGQNMYAYRPEGDTWKLMIWDIDFAFASLPPDSDLFSVGGRNIGPDLNHPLFRRRYWQALQDAAAGPLTAAKANAVLDAKYAAMTANGVSLEDPAAIKTFIASRRSYILGLIATNVPASFAITSNLGADFATGQNLLNLVGTAPLEVRTLVINGAPQPVIWTSVTNWSVKLALAGGTNTLTVQGLDRAGRLVTGATDTIRVNYTGLVESPEGRLVINEIMYHPAVPDAGYVEMHNTSTTSAFDLSGWRLRGADFTFPAGSVITPGGFLVVANDRVAFAAAYGGFVAVVGEFSGQLKNRGETLTLVQPGATPAEDRVVDQVTYDRAAPWPAAADGTGASLQLIDPAQDNDRVGNWAAVETNPPPPAAQWRYVSTTGNASANTLYLYLTSSGEVYLDDLKMVPGTLPEVGLNSVQNGDFESAFPGPWTVSANHAGSAVSAAIKHAGIASLHLVASSGGTSRDSSVWQDCSPALTSGQPYALSFWCLENTNGGTLTVRLSGSGIRTDVNLAPGAGPQTSPRYTPGAANSVRAVVPAFPKLWLNEILPDNREGATDRLGHHHPWVELFNGDTHAIDLGGCFLANNFTNLTQWPFPVGCSIPAGGFATVWLDGNPGESSPAEPHTSFTIPPVAGSLALVWANGGPVRVLDYLTYRIDRPDRSYGSFPDGAVSGRQEFYFVTPGATNNPASAPLDVFINEWMADNVTSLADPADNDFEDWYELYNAGSTVADVSGFYLGQNLTNRTQFRIPNGYTLPPHGFLLVWADNETKQNTTNQADLHAGFKLSKTGDAIGLFAPDGTVIDFVSFGPQTHDATEGRFPDGGGMLYPLVTPTPRSANLVAYSNTPPVLEVIPDAILTEGQMLVVNVQATDPDRPLQTLMFSLDAGAPAGAAINPASGLLSWRPTGGQAPGAYSIQVRVTDDGAPPLAAWRSFHVQVFPPPQVRTITPLSNHEFALAFGAIPGKTYRVDYKNTLSDSAWTPVDVPVVASSTSLTVVDDLGAQPQRFYRIAILD